MNVTGYAVEKLIDPFGILSGDRYEFFLDIEVDEDDELYNENGLLLKVLFLINGAEEKIISYNLLESATEKYIDLSLEDEELNMVFNFCKEHLNGTE
ncbi:pullulanase [Bacillus sp. DNRA2]|uniref:DUF6509 family protein n=1 Tax=Bacillus sp. DNRA2 TaxID=2723053 RepID=UPI00145E9B46|nr:DUF6509 family protein [Bacillus sp. DNRA2]NMD69971.1 pullulanase [Bacillus sp. DNRA2]